MVAFRQGLIAVGWFQQWMITLFGVGHVFNLGPRIKEEVVRRKPAAVCLELDEARLKALQDTGQRREGPMLYNLLALFQRKIAERYEAHVGEEMLAAYDAARELEIPVYLIDLDSMVTWRNLWSSVGLQEGLKLLISTLGALFIRKERIEVELDRYQRDYAGFMEAFGKDFPSVKRVVVDERNEHMASLLREIHKEFGEVVAVVGDGHIAGLRSILNDEPIEVVRLWTLRDDSWPEHGTPSRAGD